MLRARVKESEIRDVNLLTASKKVWQRDETHNPTFVPPKSELQQEIWKYKCYVYFYVIEDDAEIVELVDADVNSLCTDSWQHGTNM